MSARFGLDGHARRQAQCLPALPAGDGPVAGALVSEGLCPWCGGDLEPRSNGGPWTSYGWCEVCELGWSLHPGETEPHTWFAGQIAER